MPIDVEEKEPMLLLDVTGSMGRPAAQGSTVSRKGLVQEALKIVVQRLAAEDSQAGHEESGGGLRTVTFADGTAKDIGDINPANFTSQWNKIHWGGGTLIMPGLNTILRAFTTEFPTDPRPILMLLVITDGEAEDTTEFVSSLRKMAGGMYVAVAVVGYGPEHDDTLRAYQSVAAQNSHVRVFSLGEQDDPQPVADALLRMIA